MFPLPLVLQPTRSPLSLPPTPSPYGVGDKVAEVEHTVPPPSLPSWAEMVRRGTTLPLGQPPSHTPPGPASRHPPPLSAHILQLYKDCVARGIWAKLVFETSGGREEYSLFCSPQPRDAATAAATRAAATAAATTAAAAAAATTAAAVASHRVGKKKRRPPNQRRRERARRRREAWIERRNCNSTISATTAAHTAAAEDMNAAAALAEKSEAADTTAAENSSAAATTTASGAQATTIADRMSSAATATEAVAAASSDDLTAAEDVGIRTAVSVKAVETTAAALRERNKVWAGERRSSARASVLNQRRNSVFCDTQESPEKIRDGDNMNNSFRIQFEDSELQQEEFICSSCLSAHHDIEQSFCIFCGWKVLA